MTPLLLMAAFESGQIVFAKYFSRRWTSVPSLAISELAHLQLSLRLTNGGFGLTKLDEIAPIAYLASFLSCAPDLLRRSHVLPIDEHHPYFMSVISCRRSIGDDDEPYGIKALISKYGDVDQEDNAPSATGLQHKWSKSYFAQQLAACLGQGNDADNERLRCIGCP